MSSYITKTENTVNLQIEVINARIRLRHLMWMERRSKSCGSKSNMLFRFSMRVNSCHLICTLIVRADRFLDFGLLSSVVACRSINLVASYFTWVNCVDCWWIANYLRWQTVSESPKLLAQHANLWMDVGNYLSLSCTYWSCPWIWRSYLVIFVFSASRQFGVRSLKHEIWQHREVEVDS